MKTNTITWIALVGLTGVSLLVSERYQSGGAAGVILAAAAVKCAVLGWEFMELRSAHWFWRAGFLGVLAGILGGVGLLITRAG